MKKIEVEVFRDDSEILSSKVNLLRNILPSKIKFVMRESVSCYPPDIDSSKCSTQEISRKQIAWLNDSRSHRIFLSVESKIEAAEFINMLEKAGFSVMRKIDS